MHPFCLLFSLILRAHYVLSNNSLSGEYEPFKRQNSFSSPELLDIDGRIFALLFEQIYIQKIFKRCRNFSDKTAPLDSLFLYLLLYTVFPLSQCRRSLYRNKLSTVPATFSKSTNASKNGSS